MEDDQLDLISLVCGAKIDAQRQLKQDKEASLIA